MTRDGPRNVDLSALVGTVALASAATLVMVSSQPRDTVCATGLNSLGWMFVILEIAVAATLLGAIVVGIFARSYPGMGGLLLLLLAVAASASVGVVMAEGRFGCGRSDDGVTMGFVVFVVTLIPGLLGYLFGWFLRRTATPSTPPPRPHAHPRVEYESGDDIDAVLDRAALRVRTKAAEGLVLVGAAFTDPEPPAADGDVRLALAFGKPGVEYEPFWPGDVDVSEDVLARLGSDSDGA